jgi:exopolysaccharide production protein ExoQ
MAVIGPSARPGVPRQERGRNRFSRSATGRRVKIGIDGGTSLVLLTILFWLIFYQNLPSEFGLNSAEKMAAAVAATPALPGAEAFGGVNFGGEASSGNTLDRIIKLLMIVVSVQVIAKRWALARKVAGNLNVGFAAMMLLISLSAAWSIASETTILRSITLVTIVLVSFAIVLAGWQPRRFQQLAVPPLMYILVASLVIGMFFPDRIIEVGDDLSLKGAWHGITFTKNQLGMTASLGTLICVNRWLAREGRTSWAIAGSAVASTCLLLSRSNTSLFATLLGVLFMVFVMRVPVIRQRFSTHVVIAIAAILLLYQLVIQNVIPGAYTLLSPIMSLTGKDATLSARTIIWDIVKQHIQSAPYLGSGYGAYWPVNPTPSSPSFVFTYVMYFYPSEAHNGYLDIVNDLGYVGLACLLVFLVVYIRQGLTLMRVDRNQATLYLALLFQQMVMNMSESEWFARDSVFTIIILAVICMSRALLEARAQSSIPVRTGN